TVLPDAWAATWASRCACVNGIEAPLAQAAAVHEAIARIGIGLRRRYRRDARRLSAAAAGPRPGEAGDAVPGQACCARSSCARCACWHRLAVPAARMVV